MQHCDGNEDAFVFVSEKKANSPQKAFHLLGDSGG